MARYYIFGDVETTGLSEKTERMTEIALVRTDENFNIIDTFESFINPERAISAKITELTGITEEMVEDAPKYIAAYPEINGWWNKGMEKDDEIIFVAHNAPFDTKFINHGANEYLEKPLVVDFIDTVSLARELKPFWRNHKLDTCAKKFNIANEDHHRAMNDTMVLLKIAKRLIPEFIESGLDPVNFITRKNLHYKK